MPRTPLGHLQRSYAGRFLYGAPLNHRLRRVLATTPADPDGLVTPAPTSGAAPLTVTFTVGARESSGPVALSGDVAVSDGTRVSWPKEDLAGVIDGVSNLPTQGGYAVSDNPSVVVPFLGTGVPGGTSVTNDAFPRVDGSSGVTPGASVQITPENGDPVLSTTFGGTPTEDYAAGTYEPDVSVYDLYGRATVTQDIASITAS